MVPVPARLRPPPPDLPLLVALYVAEAAALVAFGLAASAAGLLAWLILLAATAVAIVRYRTRERRAPGQFGLTVALNLVPILLALAAGEITVRTLAQATPRGYVVRGTSLLPWKWSGVVALNRALLEQIAAEGSYLVPDDRLGWVVGPGRRSPDGLYFSSLEGLRSATPGVALSDRPTRQRVALVGDSFTFALEVGYEDSWGHRLEGALPAGTQVLNFGVSGYGVDQAFLRYARDARPWRPDVVILGLINHDLFRSMAVYAFVSFPGWPLPFAKPRFALEGDRLVLLNVPLPSPWTILAARSIGQLPYVDFDPGYREEDWQWRPIDRSFLYRFIRSRYRRWSGPDDRRSDERVRALNTAILRAFVRETRAAGSLPLVVYFPSDRDFRALARDPAWRSLAQTTLQASGVDYTDLTPCLAAMPAADRFGPGHLSRRGNAAVADCLRDDVLRMLRSRPSSP